MRVMNRQDVLDLFAGQHWVASGSQLRALAVSNRMIQRAMANGILDSPVRGVYALAAVTLDFKGRAMAAQLAGAEHGAFLSGPSAGVVHGLRNMPREPVEITVVEDRFVTLPRWGRLVRTSWWSRIVTS